jgi:hypothetical protein
MNSDALPFTDNKKLYAITYIPSLIMTTCQCHLMRDATVPIARPRAIPRSLDQVVSRGIVVRADSDGLTHIPPLRPRVVFGSGHAHVKLHRSSTVFGFCSMYTHTATRAPPTPRIRKIYEFQ